jgi:hypothetical protein
VRRDEGGGMRDESSRIGILEFFEIILIGY